MFEENKFSVAINVEILVGELVIRVCGYIKYSYIVGSFDVLISGSYLDKGIFNICSFWDSYFIG